MVKHSRQVPAGYRPRYTAARLLYAVVYDKCPLGQVLARDEDFKKLPPPDRAQAHRLVMAALRGKGVLDAVLSRSLRKPLPDDVTCLLVIGLAECLLLEGSAEHAAVSVTVEAIGQRIPALRNVANAVLRGALRDKEAILEHYGHPLQQWPDWLARAVVADYGEEQATWIAAAGQAPLDITLLTGESPFPDALTLPTGSVRLPDFRGSVEQLPDFERGTWQVQDAAAALPARLLGEVRGKRVLDLCAAPGGKTVQLCAMDAEVTAVDSAADRMSRLRENLKRTDHKAALVTADIHQWQPEQPFPFILLDAPCSALGTLRRHPDAAWLKAPAEIAHLVRQQCALLARAAGWLTPGGVLVYAVCSFLRAEGEEVMASFLQQHPRYRRLPFRKDEKPGIRDFVTTDGDIRTLPYHWPDIGGLDGFYIARITTAP